MSAETHDDLVHARAAFDAWRSGRPGPGRIPAHLWELALSLAERHAPQSVARELGLHPGRLRDRLDRRSAPRPKGRARKPAFVELRAVDLAASAPTTTTRSEPTPRRESEPVRLTLTRTDGTTLTLTLPADDLARAECLLGAFVAATA